MFESNFYQDINFFPQPQGVGAVGQVTGASFRGESEFQVWVAQQQRIEELESRVAILENNARGKIGISVQIGDLNNPHFILKKPISLLVSTEEGLYYAIPIDFDIFGEGDDERSAIDDLKEALICYFESLNNSKTKLSDKLKGKLKLLKTFIRDEN